MRSIKLISALLPLALFACTSTPQAEITNQKSAVIEMVQLQKEWKLIEIDGDSISTSVTSTLHIDSKLKATGNLGCNRFFGSTELNNNSLIINKMGTTRRVCSEEINKIEKTVSETFSDGAQVQVSETQLILKSKMHTLKYTFKL